MPRWRLFYHLVWATRDREPLITPSLQPHVYNQLRQTARQCDIIVHAVGGIEDHVHLAVSIPPAMSVALAVRRLKGASARAINAEFGATFGWQSDYGVSSFGEPHLETVVRYIERQAFHHARGKLWPEAETPPHVPTPGESQAERK